MRDICYNKWNKQKRLLCFEIWESGTFKFCLRKSAKAEASCAFEFLGWGPPVLGELQLMNLFPWNFFYCAFVMYTHPGRVTDVDGVQEGRQREGWGGRGDRKKGRQTGKEEEGRKRREPTCKEKSACWARILNLLSLPDSKSRSLWSTRPGLQRRQSTKGQTSSFLLMSHSKCQTAQWSLNFTWIWTLGTKSSFRFLGERNKLTHILDLSSAFPLLGCRFPNSSPCLPPPCHLGFRSKLMSWWEVPWPSTSKISRYLILFDPLFDSNTYHTSQYFYHPSAAARM